MHPQSLRCNDGETTQLTSTRLSSASYVAPASSARQRGATSEAPPAERDASPARSPGGSCAAPASPARQGAPASGDAVLRSVTRRRAGPLADRQASSSLECDPSPPDVFLTPLAPFDSFATVPYTPLVPPPPKTRSLAFNALPLHNASKTTLPQRTRPSNFSLPSTLLLSFLLLLLFFFSLHCQLLSHSLVSSPSSPFSSIQPSPPHPPKSLLSGLMFPTPRSSRWDLGVGNMRPATNVFSAIRLRRRHPSTIAQLRRSSCLPRCLASRPRTCLGVKRTR